MARMPGAIWRPLASNWADMPRMRAWDIFCLHTMVGSLAGTDAMFKQGGYTGTESHFGVGADGTIYQWQDTDYQADANYRGGWHIISSENADYGTGFPKWDTNDGSQVPAFTAAQIEANAEIAAWLNDEHGIPLDLISSSKVGQRGIGWHKLGVPATRGATLSQTGGELWSTATGKVCPGSRRIAQIPSIRDRARQIAGGAPEEDDDMPLTDADAKKVWDHILLAADGHGYFARDIMKFNNDWSVRGGKAAIEGLGIVKNLQAVVGTLVQALGSKDDTVDTEALLAGISEKIDEAAEKLRVTLEDVEVVLQPKRADEPADG